MGAFIGRYANRIGQAKFTLRCQDTSWPPTAGEPCTGAKARASCVRRKQIDGPPCR